MDFVTILTILIFASFLWPILQNRLAVYKRLSLIKQIEKQRKSRVITMIHRQETLSLFGIPLSRYIDIEDSEQVLRAIHLTPDNMAIDLILRTPGGLMLASEQIANALKRHKGRVTVIVPFYAMSGGTLIALSAEEILMNQDAVLGSLDPIVATPSGNMYPAISVLNALKQPNRNRSDQTLILGDIAQKAIEQIKEVVYLLLQKHYPDKKASRIADFLISGKKTHDFPLTFEQIKKLGLSVSDKVPMLADQLMVLYPQPPLEKRSVEYIPTPYIPVVPKRSK